MYFRKQEHDLYITGTKNIKKSSKKQAAISWDDFIAGVKQKSKNFQAESGRGQEFPGYYWHQDDVTGRQSSSFISTMAVQPSLNVSERRNALFISWSETAWIFQTSNKVSKKGAHLLGITSKITYTRRISKKKETICLIAVLLCKQNSHEISSSPIIWVSSLSLCANAKKKKRAGGEEGWREREEREQLLDCSLLSQNFCHQVMLDAWLLCQQAVAGVESCKKSCSCWLGWRQRIKGHHIQSERRETSQKKKKNHQQKTLDWEFARVEAVLDQQPLKATALLHAHYSAILCSDLGKASPSWANSPARIRISSDLTGAVAPFPLLLWARQLHTHPGRPACPPCARPPPAHIHLQKQSWSAAHGEFAGETGKSMALSILDPTLLSSRTTLR